MVSGCFALSAVIAICACGGRAHSVD